jgi:hypothetical protein
MPVEKTNLRSPEQPQTPEESRETLVPLQASRVVECNPHHTCTEGLVKQQGLDAQAATCPPPLSQQLLEVMQGRPVVAHQAEAFG